MSLLTEKMIQQVLENQRIIWDELRMIRMILKIGIRKEGRDMSALDDRISDLSSDIEQLRSVDQSAVALITGFAQQLKDAVDAAKAAGATDEQLQQLQDMHSAIQSQTSELAAAVAANTPADNSGSTGSGDNSGGSTPPVGNQDNTGTPGENPQPVVPAEPGATSDAPADAVGVPVDTSQLASNATGTKSLADLQKEASRKGR